jgi:hypothetical protein
VHWFGTSVFLLAALWAAIVYAAVVAFAELSAARVRLFAVPAAFVAAVVAGAGLAQMPRPTERSVALQPPLAGDRPGRRVSCAGSLTPAHHVTRGVLDVVRTADDPTLLNDPLVLDQRAVLVLQGWATDAAARHPVAAVCLLVDGKPSARVRASYGVDRPDVARAFGAADVARSGFDVQINGADLAPGPHDLVVVGVDARGRDEAIAKPRHVVVR